VADVVELALRQRLLPPGLLEAGYVAMPGPIRRSIRRELVAMQAARRRHRRRALIASFVIGAVAAGGSTWRHAPTPKAPPA
jgi:hypothetical protein